MFTALRQFPANGRKVVFIHIPKCAGTSVGQAVAGTVHRFSRHNLNYRAAFEAAQSAPGPDILQTGLRDDLGHLQYMLSYQLAQNYRFVGGHYPVGQEVLSRYAAHYHFVTVLRDPIARWKSDFAFQHSGGPSVEGDFQAVMASGMGLVMGTMMSAMLAGRYPTNPQDAMAISADAARNLQRFSVVGRVEDLVQFRIDFREKIGGNLRISHKNGTRSHYASARYDTVQAFLCQPEIEAQIEALCAADIALMRATSTAG